MDQTLVMICKDCHRTYSYLLTEYQFEQLKSGVSPRDIINPVYSEHILMMTTGVCSKCWLTMELELAGGV